MSTLASTAHLRRPAFTAAGRVVARRELTLSKVYVAGDSIDATAEGLDPRTLSKLWEQYLIDTLPVHPPATVPVSKRK